MTDKTYPSIKEIREQELARKEFPRENSPKVQAALEKVFADIRAMGREAFLKELSERKSGPIAEFVRDIESFAETRGMERAAEVCTEHANGYRKLEVLAQDREPRLVLLCQKEAALLLAREIGAEAQKVRGK